MKVNASARRNPTEDPDKIEQALRNIFPEGDIEVMENEIVLRTESIDRLKEILRDLHIRDSARSVLYKGRRGSSTHFVLNKQVAYVGKISFVDSLQALGSIDVMIEDNDMDKAINEIAPSTVEVDE